MTASINILDSDRANIGELFVIMAPVGDVAVGYRAWLLFAGDAYRSAVGEWLAYYTEVPAGFGERARVTAHTVPS